MRLAWMTALLALTQVGCMVGSGPGLCARSRWCDGDRVMMCDTTCKREVECSHVEFVAQDCAAEGEKLGIRRTCRTIITSNHSEVESCFDVDPPPCDPESATRVFCTPEGNVASCTSTPEGTFLNTTHGCDEGEVCHPTQNGVICYTPPAPPCNPETEQYCADEKTLVQCHGTPDAGYLQLESDCSPYRCGVSDAGASYCMQ